MEGIEAIGGIMALTKGQNKVITRHGKEYGTKHAQVMRREMNKGKTASQAHKIAKR